MLKAVEPTTYGAVSRIIKSAGRLKTATPIRMNAGMRGFPVIWISHSASNGAEPPKTTAPRFSGKEKPLTRIFAGNDSTKNVDQVDSYKV